MKLITINQNTFDDLKRSSSTYVGMSDSDDYTRLVTCPRVTSGESVTLFISDYRLASRLEDSGFTLTEIPRVRITKDELQQAQESLRGLEGLSLVFSILADALPTDASIDLSLAVSHG